ncbi:flavin monoamine oxidase family protein [Hyphomonas sp.]|uniref:flavin monoamine oxidase family protein n=1 Tax=Hyphomonas sp. TaxID=87 RepID=UPI0032428823
MEGATRRSALALIGATAGSAALYAAMKSIRHVQPSSYKGPIKLDGDPKGAKVLILGAGLAGMVAALELRSAGYDVQVLEYREKAGGRCWSLRGGDTYTELGGATQKVSFDGDNYINPGPWRIPYDHHGVLDYCQRLGVQLEPFIQQNHNAYIHNSKAFGGKPQRFKHIATDYRGQTSELLAKAVDQNRLDDVLTSEDREALIESLRATGALDDTNSYKAGDLSSRYRGFGKPPGAGFDGAPSASDPISLSDILQSGMWGRLADADLLDHQMPMFQPVGGMDMIAQAFAREVGDLIRFNSKVVSLQQDDAGVKVAYEDTRTGDTLTAEADWCVCTVPFSILGQMDHNLSPELTAAVNNVYYRGSAKWGLEFKRRFWEQDEHIYGGISYTDLPIEMISYPSTGLFTKGPAVLLGGYTWDDAQAFEFNAMQPEDRIKWALEFGSHIHPQYLEEYKTGVSVVWHKVPWVLGCFGIWRDKETHYANAVKIDNRVVCAGEHVSYLGAWLEGAIESSLDAIGRLHDKVING